jgi:AcrR family transcriptional regulator
MGDIAKHAGVGKGTLYRHFPDKEALLTEVIRGRFGELCEIASRAEDNEHPIEALETALRTTLVAIDGDIGLQFEMTHASDLHWEGIEEQRASLLPAISLSSGAAGPEDPCLVAHPVVDAGGPHAIVGRDRRHAVRRRRARRSQEGGAPRFRRR